MGAAPCPARLQSRTRASKPALPRLARSPISRKLLFHRRLRGLPELFRPLQQRPPRARKHPLAVVVLLQVARAAASASARNGASGPASARGAVGVAARKACTGERGAEHDASAVELLRHARRRDRAEADRPAARRDRLQQPSRSGAGQHEVREGRRAPRASSAAQFCDSSFMRSASTITNTRRRASNGPQRRLAHDARRARRRPGCRARRAARPRRGPGARPIARAARCRRGRPNRGAISAAAKACAAARLPLPAGPWKRYACDSAASSRRSRLERDARARLVLGGGLESRAHLEPRQDVRVHFLRRARCVDPHIALGGAARRARRMPPPPRAGALALALEPVQLTAPARAPCRRRRRAGK